MGPRILAATGGEQIILSGHRQRLTEIEVAVISYELRSLDLSSFVRLDVIRAVQREGRLCYRVQVKTDWEVII